MKAVAPASKARSIDAVSSSPVIMTTGTRSPAGTARIAAQAVKPSIPGMITSSRTTPGRTSARISMALGRRRPRSRRSRRP